MKEDSEKSYIADKAVIQALNEIATNRGLISPEAVVEEAANVDSPLHRFFEWDDTEAAEKYRLGQARRLLRITIRYIKMPDNKQIQVRAFYSLTTDRDKGGYRSSVDILSNADLRSQLLQDALDEMEYFQEKYAELEELVEIFSVMRKVSKKTSLNSKKK